MSLYDTLGVDKGATQEDIKKAYRNKAKKHHEDAGGDKDEMIDVNKAYAVLKDPVKRDRYDKTGETQQDSFEMKFQQYVQSVFMAIVEANDVDYSDLIEHFRGYTKDVIKKFRGQLEGCDRKLKKLDKVAARLGSSTENRILMVVQHNIEEAKREKIMVEENIKFMEDCLECLSSYHYKFDEVPEVEYRFNLNDWKI